MKIGINGLGRIGGQVLRIAFESHHGGLEVVHINDLASAEDLAYLLEFDTTYHTRDLKVHGEDDVLMVDGQSISVSAESDPARIPWGEKGVDVVLESTGQFRTRPGAAKHIVAGAKKVLISAPGKSMLDGHFVVGINDQRYDRHRHNIISMASCTTNCLAPVAKVLNDEFGIEHGMINTIHAYTSSQNLVDGWNSKRRRGRAAAENLVPTSTGAATTIGLVLPALAGKLHGCAVRAPIKCGSLLDFTCTLQKGTNVDEVNNAFRHWAGGPLKGILAVDDRELVSSDIVGKPYSAIVTTKDTYMVGDRFLKVLAWYDNEWAFAQRCVDMITRML
ncbi:type I glyceraldehyde-3-phosphate dehydrogenase [uncultured Microbulbifer sp.]|uniref:type I glyceraldehyde-3-phosphate dehydrogenase n=1 Tax=uncultured Microbulbifer sp. TaxID=348147 RepID=UPI0025EE4B02|nr:type I glyceraldehyde-3-phosphate dehydrogenase [uncultured Microbulbifer sp.]